MVTPPSGEGDCLGCLRFFSWDMRGVPSGGGVVSLTSTMIASDGTGLGVS